MESQQKLFKVEVNEEKKAERKHKTRKEDNPKHFAWIAQTSEFIFKEAIKDSKKANLYAIQYGLITIGEAATKVKASFEDQIPKKYIEMPWDNLIKIRQLASHHFHRMNYKKVVEEVSKDIIQIKLLAQNFQIKNYAPIEKKPDEKILFGLMEHYKEIKAIFNQNKKEKNRKQKNESESQILNSRILKDIKYLEKILEEFENLNEFVNSDPKLQSRITQDAIKMSLILIALSVKEHLSNDFKVANPLEVEIGTKEKSCKLTWDELNQNRKDLMHGYYQYNSEVLKSTVEATLKASHPIKQMVMQLKQQTSEPVSPELFETSSQPYSQSVLISKSSTIFSQPQTTTTLAIDPKSSILLEGTSETEEEKDSKKPKHSN